MTINLTNTNSHRDVFDPVAFEKRVGKVHIIGLGAVGSRVVFELAKAGLTNLHLWDFDTVEGHNVGNQMFGIDHVGSPKEVAMADILIRDFALDLEGNLHGVYNGEQLSGMVFVCVDSMAIRKLVFSANKWNTSIPLIIEARMGVSEGFIYSINPSVPMQMKFWEEKSDYSDEDTNVQRSACGTTLSVGSTAGICAMYSVSQMIRWYRIQTGQFEDGSLDVEVLFGLEDCFMLTTKIIGGKVVTG